MAIDFHGSAIESFWTGTSFPLSSAIFQPPIAALSHIFGRMPALTFCVICFLIGIIISGLARNFTVMLAGRTTQGVGGGGVILLNDIIVTDMVPMRLPGAYFGAIGGALAYKATWASTLAASQ